MVIGPTRRSSVAIDRIISDLARLAGRAAR